VTFPYLDTSALAKWYLNEARSEEFERFLRAHDSAAISRLTVVEFRCLLARRRRAREISPPLERDLFAAFLEDISRGFLSAHPLEDAHAFAALEMLSTLKAIPLRTLDALHLAIAREISASLLATADLVMAQAATALGLQVARFD